MGIKGTVEGSLSGNGKVFNKGYIEVFLEGLIGHIEGSIDDCT